MNNIVIYERLAKAGYSAELVSFIKRYEKYKFEIDNKFDYNQCTVKDENGCELVSAYDCFTYEDFRDSIKLALTSAVMHRKREKAHKVLDLYLSILEFREGTQVNESKEFESKVH